MAAQETLNQEQVVSFHELWSAYPSFKDPCDKHKYHNQCAIRLGVALVNSGASTASFKGTRCGIKEHVPEHLLRAHEVAAWLDRRPLAGILGPRVLKGKDCAEWQNKIQGQTGIIFFSHYWSLPGQTARTGDHIDLWNGARLTMGWATVPRFFLHRPQVHIPEVRVGPVHIFGRDSVLDYSNLGDSLRIVLWKVI